MTPTVAGSSTANRCRPDYEHSTEKTQKQPGVSDYRLSRAGQAVGPERVPLILSLSPVVYLVNEIDACMREASGRMLFGIRIDRCLVGVR
jgi:hypothetical protein